jgi:hypothetical protein
MSYLMYNRDRIMSAIGELCSLSASETMKASHPNIRTKPDIRETWHGMPPVYQLQPDPSCATLIRNPNRSANKIQETVCV